MIESTRTKVATYALLSIATLLVLYPLSGIVLASLNPPDALVKGFSIPESLSFSNYVEAWTQARFSTYMAASVIVSTGVVLGTVFLSILAGFAFGVLDFRGRDVFFYLLLAGLVIPAQSIIVPLFFEFKTVNLTNTYWALILPQIGALLAFGSFWMRAYFLSAPTSLVDAAKIDGASSWVILWRVLAPVGKPAILTLALLLSLWSWNNFLLPLVMVTDEKYRTAPLGLAFFRGQYSTNFPLMAAAAVTIALPMVVLYLFLQKNFIQGMTSGSVNE